MARLIDDQTGATLGPEKQIVVAAGAGAKAALPDGRYLQERASVVGHPVTPDEGRRAGRSPLSTPSGWR